MVRCLKIVIAVLVCMLAMGNVSASEAEPRSTVIPVDGQPISVADLLALILPEPVISSPVFPDSCCTTCSCSDCAGAGCCAQVDGLGPACCDDGCGNCSGSACCTTCSCSDCAGAGCCAQVDRIGSACCDDGCGDCTGSASYIIRGGSCCTPCSCSEPADQSPIVPQPAPSTPASAGTCCR